MRVRTATAGSIGLLLLASSPSPSPANERADVTLQVRGPVDRQSVTYECRSDAEAEPTSMDVDYVNLANGSLAVLPVDGEPVVFVAVLAASGVKYVAGSKVWWIRGPRGDLYDERSETIGEGSLCRVSRG